MFLSAIHHFLDCFCVGELFTLTFIAVSQSAIICTVSFFNCICAAFNTTQRKSYCDEIFTKQTTDTKKRLLIKVCERRAKEPKGMIAS